PFSVVRLAGLAFVLAISTACAHRAAAPSPPSPARAPTATLTGANIRTAPAPLSEAQAWSAAEAINEQEVRAAKLAERKAQDPDVKGFAQHMLQSHGDEERTEKHVAGRLHTPAAASPLRDRLQADERNTATHLSTVAGAAFDHAYMDAQIKGHED